MLYRSCRVVVMAVAYTLFGVRVRGRERVPRTGVYILAPSHRSMLDIPFTAAVTRRPLRFLAKRELFGFPLLGRLFRALGGMPVDRDGTDRTALRTIEAALRGGDPVVIFPEGTRGAGGALGPIASGAAYVALKTGVAVVPVGIGGSEHGVERPRGMPWRSKVTVVVGEPIPVSRVEGTVKRSAIAAVDEELRSRLQACFDDARAVAAVRSGRRPAAGR